MQANWFQLAGERGFNTLSTTENRKNKIEFGWMQFGWERRRLRLRLANWADYCLCQINASMTFPEIVQKDRWNISVRIVCDYNANQMTINPHVHLTTKVSASPDQHCN